MMPWSTLFGLLLQRFRKGIAEDTQPYVSSKIPLSLRQSKVDVGKMGLPRLNGRVRALVLSKKPPLSESGKVILAKLRRQNVGKILVDSLTLSMDLKPDHCELVLSVLANWPSVTVE